MLLVDVSTGLAESPPYFYFQSIWLNDCVMSLW